MVSASRLWLPLAVATALGCAANAGPFVWVDDYASAPRPSDQDYIIAPGDVIGVRVYNQESMSGRVRVRADGRISLPFVNDVKAAGLTPVALSEQLQKQLKSYIVNPVITVSLEEARPFEVFAVGEVAHPGRFTLEPSATVLQAIAAAGGLTPYANRDRIFVVRWDGKTPLRIRFKYDDLSRLAGKAATFRLQTGDTVVVE